MGKRKWGTDGPITLSAWLSRKRLRLQDWAIAAGVSSYSEVIDVCNSLGVLAPPESVWIAAVPPSTVPEEGIVVVEVGTVSPVEEQEEIVPKKTGSRRGRKEAEGVTDNLSCMSSREEIIVEGVRGSRIPLEVVRELWTRRLEGLLSPQCDAYVTDVLSRVKPDVDLAGESLVLHYLSAVERADFHRHQILADWVLRLGITTGQIEPGSAELWVGAASYRSLYLRCPTWTVYHELSGCLPRIIGGSRCP